MSQYRAKIVPKVLIKSLSDENKVLFRMPFNGFYIVSSILMNVERKITLFKKYTLYSFEYYTIIPLILFLTGLSFLLTFLNENFFKMLIILMS